MHFTTPIKPHPHHGDNMTVTSTPTQTARTAMLKIYDYKLKKKARFAFGDPMATNAQNFEFAQDFFSWIIFPLFLNFTHHVYTFCFYSSAHPNRREKTRNQIQMGELFHLVAPRAKQRLEMSGDVEQMFDEYGEALVRLLSVPIIPPRRLYFSKLRTPSMASVLSDATNPASECGTITMKNTKKRTRANEHLENHERVKTRADFRTTIAYSMRSITIIDLPTELHLQIMRHIDSIDDLVCFSLTSRHFWDICQENILAYYASLRGQWAGENIVCVGDQIEPGDLPPGLFSQTELCNIYQDLFDVWSHRDSNDDGIDRVQEFALSPYIRPTASELQNGTLLAWESDRVLRSCSDRAQHNESILNIKWNELCIQESTYFPEDQPWVLRNLTTKEFVRAEAIALKPQYIHGPNIDVLGFGDVLLYRILWSKPQGTFPDMYRGIWAGHRFDIVALTKHKEDTKDTEWTDVSDEIAKEIATI